MISRKQVLEIVKLHAKSLKTRTPISSLQVAKLGSGENNLNILITINRARKYVLRVCLRKEKHALMKNEYAYMNLVPKGVGGHAYVFDDSCTLLNEPYFILEYVPGTHRFRWGPRELKAFARLLARLHAVKRSWEGRHQPRTSRYDIVQKTLEHINSFGSLAKKRDAAQFLPAMMRYVKTHRAMFLALKEFSLVHGDPCINNIVWSKNKPALIDWENCAFHDPAIDLARIYYPKKGFYPWTIALSDEQVNLFVKEYQRHTSQSKSPAHDKTLPLRVQFWNTYDLFFDLLYCLWRIEHFDKEHRGLPKRKYLACVALLKALLSERLATNH
jgi:aminoglycoside phosphotransferase (APT) family kinase protein